MKRWMVETRVIVNRTYFVDAENEKEAEAASCNADADLDEETNEETISIKEVPTDDSEEYSGALANQDAPTRDGGERLHPISDINDLDDVCRELGIQDSPVTPAEAVRELNAEIERLSTLAANSARVASLEAALREAREQFAEICRGTDMRAGNGDGWSFGIANKAHEAIDAALQQSPPQGETK